MAHNVKRKGPNRVGTLDSEQWAQVFKYYAEGHSITTLAVLFNIAHAIISERLKAAGVFKAGRKVDPRSAMRDKLIPKGRFAGSDFFK